MTFQDLLQKRRSIRTFKDTPVPTDVIRELIRECTLAPSSMNGQPWRFVIVQDKGMIQRMSDESRTNILNRIIANPDDYAAKYRKMLADESFNVFWNAPCVVLIVGDSSWKNLYVDCALAAGYFMMGATARGLGTCWINMGAQIQDPHLRAELGIPADCAIVAPISVGYPESIPPAPKRKAPEILKTVVNRAD